ncbi:MAG: protein kinase [Planctomycetia bacterium]|nr:protein kinase [Planctomycetia bacterium]
MDEQQLEQLAQWEEQLARGEGVPQSSELQPRLVKQLACLKMLDGLRKRNHDTPASKLTRIAPLPTNTVKYQLPCRFGKFDLIRELGRGGFGVVFLARDRVLDNLVALKMPHSHVLTNDELRERFLREARVAAGLQYPHIVTVHEAGEVGPVNYIVYAYCPGITLNEWLRTQKDQAPISTIVEWVACLAEAVAYAHQQGVLHRDLKPSNILLHDNSQQNGSIAVFATCTQTITPKITDFGLAKLAREKTNTATGAILGTPAYMAPEQTSGKNTVGPSVDIHALGVILYELLAGHPPYRGETDIDTLQLVAHQEPLPLRKIRPKLPLDLETICMKCLQKDPALRYAGTRELAEDLRRFLKHEPIHARPVSWIERSWRSIKRHPVVSGLAAALLIAITLGLSGILYQNHHRAVQADATLSWLNKYHELLRNDVQLAQEMINDVRTEKQGREKLIHALNYYDALLRDPQIAPALQLEAARLACQAGHIHFSLGQYKQAISRFQQSISLYESNQTRQNTPVHITLEYAAVYGKLAQVYRNMEKWDLSELIYRQAIRVANQVLTTQPDHIEAMAFICNALTYNGLNLRAQQRKDEAERDYQFAINIIEKALRIQPENSLLLMEQALILDDYGDFLMKSNRIEEARQFITQALELRKQLYQRPDKLLKLPEALARSYWRMGVLSARTNDIVEAEKYYRISIEMNDKLRQDNPGIAGYTHNAAADRYVLGSLLEAHQYFEPAELLYREALQIRKHCASEFPNHEVNYYDYALLHFKLAGLLRKCKRYAEADKQYEEGLLLNEKLIAQQPAKAKNQELYSSQLYQLARQYEQDKLLEKAFDAHQRLLKAREQLVRDFPGVISYQRDLAASFNKLAVMQQQKSLWSASIHSTHSAISIRNEILNHQECTTRDRLFLIQDQLLLGNLLRQTHQLDDGRQQLIRAASMLQKVQQEAMTDTATKLHYAHLLSECGKCLLEVESKLSRELFANALNHYQSIFAQKPDKANRIYLARIHHHLGDAYWHERHDIGLTLHHYLISHLLSPSASPLTVDTTPLIRWCYLRWRSATKTTSKN